MKSAFKRRRSTRGFALLMVVLIVALVAVSAAALLDFVEVDLTIVGEHRKTLRADANAVGALYEVVADAALPSRLPEYNAPGLRYQYAGMVAGVPTRDPANVFGSVAMTTANSAFVRNLGTPVDESYTADIILLRAVPRQNTGLTEGRAIFYEISTQAFVAGGKATKEVRAEVYRDITVQAGLQLPHIHAR